jgi:hypothetical protein
MWIEVLVGAAVRAVEVRVNLLTRIYWSARPYYTGVSE